MSEAQITYAGSFTLAWAIPLSAAMAAIVSPWGRQFAWRIGAIDHPNPRKLHDEATARLGGLSAALAVLTCVAVWVAVDPRAADQCARYWGLLPGALLMFLVGLYDDLYDLKPHAKLVFQVLAGSVLWYGGVRVEAVDLPFAGAVELHSAGPLVTVLWVVAVTNALNLLDGIDGLAAGTAALASSTFLLIAGYNQIGSILGLLSTVLIGACVVLVVNNFRSPKLFLGDSGSLLLGILLASTAILTANAAGTPTRSDGPMAARLGLAVIPLAVPLVDMAACIIRRVLVGRSIFSADRGHIHHLLLSFGFRPSTVVTMLCGATAAFGLIAAGIAHMPDLPWLIRPDTAEVAGLVVLTLASLVVYRRLGYLSLTTWLRCRRANRLVLRLIARLRALSDGKPERARQLRAVRSGIRHACRALDIDYICVAQAAAPNTDPGAGERRPLLEVGKRPLQTVTRHVHAAGRAARGALTVVLGASRAQQPAGVNAKESLILPLLSEVAALLHRLSPDRAYSDVRSASGGAPLPM